MKVHSCFSDKKLNDIQEAIKWNDGIPDMNRTTLWKFLREPNLFRRKTKHQDDVVV